VNVNLSNLEKVVPPGIFLLLVDKIKSPPPDEILIPISFDMSDDISEKEVEVMSSNKGEKFGDTIEAVLNPN